MKAPSDGIFLLVVHVTSQEQTSPPRPLNVTVHIEMKADYGYLSATDWPNLPVRTATSHYSNDIMLLSTDVISPSIFFIFMPPFSGNDAVSNSIEEILKYNAHLCQSAVILA